MTVKSCGSWTATARARPTSPHQISNHEFDGCEQHNCDESHLIQETNDTDTQRTAVYTHKKISFTNPLIILYYSKQSKFDTIFINMTLCSIGYFLKIFQPISDEKNWEILTMCSKTHSGVLICFISQHTWLVLFQYRKMSLSECKK